jgi:hypothetical protein
MHAGLPQATTATNYIGRSVLACAGSSLEGIVTGRFYSNEGPSWIIALENGRSTCVESRALKPLLLPKEDRLLLAATALQKPSVLTGLWVRKQHGNRWCLGRIVDTDINNRNTETTWQVRHHDGDKSDYNLAEIADLLLPPALNRHLKFPKKCLAWPFKNRMAGLGLFDQKSALTATMPIATAFKFCVGHRKNGLLNR